MTSIYEEYIKNRSSGTGNYIYDCIRDAEDDEGDRERFCELKRLAELVEEAREAFRRDRDIHQALALLDTALDAPDRAQQAKYDAWLKERFQAEKQAIAALKRKEEAQSLFQTPWYMLSPQQLVERITFGDRS